MPHVEGLELEQRIEFLGDMGGDYYDYIPFGDGRLGIVCGDVMGKGLAAALIMAMARSLLHDAIAPGKQPGRRHGRGQRRAHPRPRGPAPAVLPHAGPGRLRPGRPQPGHRRRRPQPRARRRPRRRERGAVARRRPRRAHRPAVPGGPHRSWTPAPRWRSTPTASRRRATPSGALYGLERLEHSLERCRSAPVRDTLDGRVGATSPRFRGDSAPTDDATLLLVRLT